MPTSPRPPPADDIGPTAAIGRRREVGCDGIDVRLEHRTPLWPDSLFGHLVATAVLGVEEWRRGAYRRTLRLPHAPGIVALRPERDHVAGRLLLGDGRDRAAAVLACRRILDLDADPGVVDGCLSADAVLAPLVAAAPGRRVPGAADGDELAVRAVLGQQVSTAAARTHAARLVARHGTAITDPEGGLTHLFPDTGALTGVDPATLALPQARRRTLTGLIAALADGRLDLRPGADVGAARAGLAALAGIGPWTVDTIAMRALGDRDAWLPTDLGVRAAALRLDLPRAPGALTVRAARWQPWRAYAVQHLWATGTHAVNQLPTAD